MLKGEALNIHSGHGMAVPHRRLKCSNCDELTHRISLTKALREKKITSWSGMMQMVFALKPQHVLDHRKEKKAKTILE